MLTESKGFILNFAVYTGVTDDLGGVGHAANVVLHLTKNKLNLGHSLYMDNFYNSYDLAKKLLEAKTYCTGTLRNKRKNNPKEVEEMKLERGQTTCRYADGVMIGKWRDKRDVLYISTEYKNDMVTTTNRRGQEKQKPKPIAAYNMHMSGIDFQDQMLSYYSGHRKSLRWYKKLGIHIINMMLFNSYILYNRYAAKKTSLYDFKLAVVEDLLPPLENEENVTKIATLKSHLPKKCPKKEGGRTLRRRCKHCWATKKIRKETQYICVDCPGSPGLCLEPCFFKYHL